MTNGQRNLLGDVINRKHKGPAPVGFIVDSPCLPGWAGISTIDYYASGVPQNVPTENMQAFIDTINELERN
jgi:hypothetical protein